MSKPGWKARQTEDTPALPAPDTASREGYVDPDAGSATQRGPDEPQSTDSDAVGTAATDTTSAQQTTATRTASGDSQSEVSLSDIDAADTSVEEFQERFVNGTPRERAAVVHQALQDQSNSRRFLGEAMGPVGGAIATAGMGLAGLSGTAATAGAVLPAAAIAYAGKQSIKHDSVRTGITNTLKAPVQLGKQASHEVTNRFGFSKQSAADTGGGAMSGQKGTDNNRFS